MAPRGGPHSARGFHTAQAFLAAMDKVAERDPETMAELEARRCNGCTIDASGFR